MQSLCRVCLQSNVDKKDVFVSLLDGDGFMSTKMMKCAQVEVREEDLLPKEICPLCADRLNTAYEFKVQCEKTYRELMDIVKSKSCLDIKLEESDVVCIKQEDGALLEYGNISDLLTIQGKVGRRKSKRNVDGNITKMLMRVDMIGETFVEADCLDGVDDYVTNLSDALAGEDEELKKQPGKRGRKRKEKDKRFQKKHICDECGRTFTSQTSLEGHIRRHRGEKPFVCSTCGKSFFVLGELKKHFHIHKSVKPYQCKYCERRFADWGSRLKHERCHRGERPYSCTICAKSFAYSYVLSRHKLTHTGAKLFSCEKCKKEFSFKHQLNSHLNKEHKDKTESEIGGNEMPESNNEKNNDTNLDGIHEEIPKKIK